MGATRRTSNHILVAVVGATPALALFHLGAVTGAVIEASVLNSAISRSAGVVSIPAEATSSSKQSEPTLTVDSPLRDRRFTSAGKILPDPIQ